MRKWFKNNKLYLAGVLVGSIGGYLYWHQVGCASGTCMITSKLLNSTIYGAVMGALFFGLLKKENKSSTAKKYKE